MVVIASRVANALIENVQVGPMVNLPGRRVLDNYRKRYGGMWVGGRLTVTTTSVEFHPNAVNRSIQSGDMDLDIDLRSIESVELLPGVLTKIVAMRVDDRVIKVRCFGAAKIADEIRTAVATARSTEE